MPEESTAPNAPRSPCGRALPRVCQISDYHCGPAVLEMLVAGCGVVADQERLTELARAQNTISTEGIRIDQLATAVSRLHAGLCLWYKTRATPEDLYTLVRHHGCPAGVEWQGFFEDSEEQEDYISAEYGHYCVVTDVDPPRGLITLRDPYPDFCSADRVFRLDWFVSRWWDANLIPRPNGAVLTLVEDRHMLFVVTVESAQFPASLAMRRG